MSPTPEAAAHIQIDQQLTAAGWALDCGFEYKKRDRLTRAERWKLQDEDETYSNRDLFAKDDNHAEEIINAVRLENTQAYRQDLRRVEYGDERDPDMRAFLQEISPNNNIDKIDVPLFVIQGQNDPRVPVTEAEQIVKSLRDANKPVWYMNALNEGHGYRKKENRDIYQQAVVLFFKEHLID